MHVACDNVASGLSCNALIGNARREAPRCTMHTVTLCQARAMRYAIHGGMSYYYYYICYYKY